MSAPVSGAVLDLRAWLADGGTGPGLNDPLTTEWTDLSGNGNHGTLTGCAGTTASGYAGSGTLADPYRCVFDGTNDYVSVADHASLNFGVGAFTLEAWVYIPSTTGVEKALIAKQSTTATAYPGYSLMLYDNTARVIACQNNASAENRRLAISAALTAGSLYHVVGVYDGNECYLYTDGSLNVASRTGTAGAHNTDNTRNLRVSSRELSSIYTANSVLVSRVYPFALTPEQVQQNYYARWYPYIPPMTDHYSRMRRG